MMDIAIVENNVITNVIVVLDGSEPADYGGMPLPEEAWIGDYYIPLETLKAEKILQSKADLAAYLESHPILWTDGLEYSITAEKQSQLMGKLMAATMAKSAGNTYDLTWNSTGEVCKSWELAGLTALAFAIDARVTALVSYQQTQEVAMRNAVTQEALETIVVDYDSVSEDVSA